MFQWQLKYFSASETGSHICDPRLGRVKTQQKSVGYELTLMKLVSSE